MHGPLGCLGFQPSPDCIVGFHRVPDLGRALRQANLLGLAVAYVYPGLDGGPAHATVIWRGVPIILTDAYEGSEIR